MSSGTGQPGDPGDTAPAAFGADSGFTPGHTLPPGQMLRDYRIDAVLGEGGFGVVYLALDTALERRVAIKEYLPAGMASRARASLTVFVKSPSHADAFAAGLRSFVNEARLLARFDHPALVKVHQFWEQNGTAYMVMPYYEGATLKRTLAALSRPPTEAEVRQWLMPLLDALAVLHAERCFHRDIAPDNILITADGPLLLDFGAARRVIGDMTQALTAVLKPGFAPIEQYGEVPGMSQGPWTDIFALASVLYVALAGVKPMSSVERVMDDRYRPLTEIAAGRASPAFLKAIDHALALRPADRPQSVAEFQALLDGRPAGSVDPRPLPAPSPPPRAAHAPAPAAGRDDAAPLADADATVVADIGFEPADRRSPTGPPAPAPASVPDAERGEPQRVPAVAPAPLAAPGPARAPRPGAGPPLSKAAPPQPVALPSTTTATGLDHAAPAGSGRRGLLRALAGAGAVLAAGSAWYWMGRRAALEPPAPTVAAPPAINPTPVPPPAAAVEAPPAPAAVPSVPSPPAAPPPAVPAAAPAPAPPPAAAPARPAAVKPPVRADDKAVAERAAAAQRRQANQARCSDILQKASLEPLTASEADFLRRECR